MTKYHCPACDESFDVYDNMEEHWETCPTKIENKRKTQESIKNLREERKRKVMNQDTSLINKSVLYTTSDTTITSLVQEYGVPMAMMRPGAYRKWMDHCPHCDHEMSETKWATCPNLKEICAAEDRFTTDLVKDTRFMLVSECPRCGKKSIRHYEYTELMEYDWIDHKQIIEWLKMRGVKTDYG